MSDAPAAPTYLLLNGKAAQDESLRGAVKAARAAGARIEVRVTWEKGDAARIVGEAVAAKAPRLIAGGGDGTLGAVITALAALPGDAARRPAAAVLPMGTANDFATGAGIDPDPHTALATALHAPATPVDLLHVVSDAGERWAVNVISGGFGAEVTAQTNAGMKKVLGGLAYFIHGLGQLGQLEPVPARIAGPAFAWQGGFIALGIGNGRLAGGGQPVCPDACINDGLLDVTVIPEGNGLAATLGTVLTQGKQGALGELAVRARLPWITLESPEPMALNLDGEPLGVRQARIECRPGWLRMHLPPDSPLLVR